VGATAVARRPHPTRLALAWVGHSTVVFDVGGVRLITDPLLRRRVAHLRRVPPLVGVEGVDVILVSHAHRDHLDVPSLRLLPHTSIAVVPAGCAGLVAQAGLTQIVEVEPGDTLEVRGVPIVVTAALHDPGRGVRKTGPLPVGYLIGDRVTAYFAGDTDLFPEMDELRGLVDVALLPISGWGPRVPAGHLDPVRAALALKRIAPRTCIPIHWGTMRPVYRRAPYALDTSSAARFEALARSAAPDVRVAVLRPGERLVVG
jgi:L-ascorbate metabolism protein UlaG (beta-lactamase superfamily)